MERIFGTSKAARSIGDASIREVSPPSSDSDLYTPDLVEGVKRFQASRGISSDGVIAETTLRQLRTSVATRIEQIELTMERWRWLPDPTASSLLVVNIPEFRLYALERNADRVLARERMDVIVGSAFNVYLHDTPQQSLFNHERRDFSHGCIRASDPESLAEFVLADEPGWERQHIEASIANPELRTVTLSHPVPTFVVYATVVANADGTASFLPDLYGHDAALARALAARATKLAGLGSSVSISHPSTIP
jgi:murein L,D-transpeptidase YcbB/YkuD